MTISITYNWFYLLTHVFDSLRKFGSIFPNIVTGLLHCKMCVKRHTLCLQSYKHDWSRKFGTVLPDIVTGSMYCFGFIYNASHKTDIMFVFIQAWLVELLNHQYWTYQLTDCLRVVQATRVSVKPDHCGTGEFIPRPTRTCAHIY